MMSVMKPPLRLLLVDDNPDFRASAVTYLSSVPEFQVVGETASGEEALACLARQPVDLVLLDLAMTGMDGLAVTRRLKAGATSPKVIIVTFHDAQEYRRLAKAAGADGFVGKTDYTAELLLLVTHLFPDWFSEKGVTASPS